MELPESFQGLKPKHFAIWGCMGITDCVLITAIAVLAFTGNSPQSLPEPAPPTATATFTPTLTATTAPTLTPTATRTLTATVTFTPTRTPLSEEELADQAWQVFQSYIGFLKNHDIENANKLLWPSLQLDLQACIQTMSEETCWKMIDYTSSGAEKLKQEDFINVWADEKQLVLSNNPVITANAGSVKASQNYLLFAFDPEGKIRVLIWSSINWNGNSEDALREMMLDGDQDGITDHDENCGLLPSDMCTKTDPQKRDTDGDGYWDKIEEAAKTDPNDPASHL